LWWKFNNRSDVIVTPQKFIWPDFGRVYIDIPHRYTPAQYLTWKVRVGWFMSDNVHACVSLVRKHGNTQGTRRSRCSIYWRWSCNNVWHGICNQLYEYSNTSQQGILFIPLMTIDSPSSEAYDESGLSWMTVNINCQHFGENNASMFYSVLWRNDVAGWATGKTAGL